MAEEVQNSSGADSASIKRKYEDQSTPPPPLCGARRLTGFSAPIASQSPDSGHAPTSYNSVPPPVDEIQLAKQRAQEIASRLFSDVEAKRPRVESGGGGFDSIDSKGFSSGLTDIGHKLILTSSTSLQSSYGYPGPSKKIEIPNGRVGVIIGKGGETIKYLQHQSGAKIQVTRDMDADPNSTTRAVELMGTSEQIAKAEQLITGVLGEAESGGSGIVSRRVNGLPSGAKQYVMQVPNNKVGLIIGKGGETIKDMQARTGARIQVIPLHLPPGDTSMERTVQIDGSSEQIEAAKQLVIEVISENRLRNSAMTGVYGQQGYQTRPPSSWTLPGPQMQQPGYGYVQPRAYPGQSPQYNMTQPPYAGYPMQQTSGGYSTGWDQTTALPNQQTTQGGGYDYYSQQPVAQQQQGPSAATDNAAYVYNQQGQVYTQDGYGGYQVSAPQSGYGQPQPNPLPGYDQQQVYNATSGYGNVTNPTPEGYGAHGDSNQAPPPVQSSAMGQQGYNGSHTPSPNPSYLPQGSAQPNYGVPSTSQTSYGTPPPSGYGPSYGPPQTLKTPASQPAYCQPQQSPSAQGGYVQPAAVQPVYPHSQPPAAQSGHTQPDSGAQRAPPSGYGTAAAPMYAPAPYGVPPVTQPSYGGQQQPPYNSFYGSCYSQPPVYPADGNAAGGNAPVVQPGGVAKALPQS